MKILLLNPPRQRAQTMQAGYTFSPALTCLSAVLRQGGYTPKIIDLFSNHDWNSITETLRRERADIVGITCLTNTRMYVRRLARIVKTICPGATVVVGGAHPTVMYRQMLDDPAVDVVVIGEGDLTFKSLVEAVECGDGFEKVGGIAYREEGGVVKTEPRPLVRDLDSLPLPDYYHLSQSDGGRPPRTGIAIGRGCPYNCQFCASSSVWGSTYRSKSARRVADEIEFVLARSADGVIFVGDDMIGVTEAATAEFCEEIMSRGLKFKWYANARVDSVSESLLVLLKKAGCMMICYGIESGSPKILKTINKRITVDQAKEAFHLTHKVGISCQATVMVGNPGDGADTIRETEALLDTIRPDHLWVSYATLYPGTGLYELAKRQGLIDDTYWASDRVAPVYLGAMSLPSMFYQKWRINYRQARRRRELLRFAKGLLSEVRPQRVWAGLKMAGGGRP
jgi:anaerobic magnesium-protoporphyrin IX monomethyl ester cyclase